MKAIATAGVTRSNADRPEISRQDVLEQQQNEWKAVAGGVFDGTMEVFQFLEVVLYVAAAEPS